MYLVFITHNAQDFSRNKTLVLSCNILSKKAVITESNLFLEVKSRWCVELVGMG